MIVGQERKGLTYQTLDHITLILAIYINSTLTIKHTHRTCNLIKYLTHNNKHTDPREADEEGEEELFVNICYEEAKVG